MNIALQKEIDNLEQERIKLKDALRSQALVRGERAVSMGLNVEDLIAVEDYAARLRSGGGDKGATNRTNFCFIDWNFKLETNYIFAVVGGRPTLGNAHLEKLAVELERVHVEAAEARETLDKTEARL